MADPFAPKYVGLKIIFRGREQPYALHVPEDAAKTLIEYFARFSDYKELGDHHRVLIQHRHGVAIFKVSDLTAVFVEVASVEDMFNQVA
jgi:hypothetical protein